MPTKTVHLILLLILLLTGCTPAAVTDTPTPLPSRTPAPPSPTPSKTSFWRIVTSTPSNLLPTITVSPLHLQDNSCPATNEDFQYPFPETISSELELIDPILEALNYGITLTHLQNNLNQIKNENFGNKVDEIVNEDGFIIPVYEYVHYKNPISMRDLTGDGVNEVIFNAGLSRLARLQVYSCQQGRYTKLFFHEYHSGTDLDFLDINGNNIPEIINLDYGYLMVGPNLVYIYEWDGEQISSSVLPHGSSHDNDFPDAFVTWDAYCSDYQWKADGTYDLLMRGHYWGFGEYNTNGPYREYSFKLAWNDSKFQATEKEPAPPEYRFQAVQDGDWETWRGNFEEALAFYDQALHDPSLKKLAQSGMPSTTPDALCS